MKTEIRGQDADQTQDQTKDQVAVNADASWTSKELKNLRYRLGWSQAELARSLKMEVAKISAWELGRVEPDSACRNQLETILRLAESNAERIQRRPIAEVIMRDRGLSQIHDFDVLDSLHTSSTKKA